MSTNDANNRKDASEVTPGISPPAVGAFTTAMVEQLKTLCEVSRMAGTMTPEMNQSISCAIGAMCINLAQSSGLMHQTSVNQYHQMMITSHAGMLKGLVELYRPRGQPSAPSPVQAGQIGEHSDEALVNALIGLLSRISDGNGNGVRR